MTKTNTQADNVIPMFQPIFEEKKENIMATQKEISVFDVKELYDRAYAAQEYGAKSEENFQALIAKAVQLDMAYRQQLAKKTNFRYVSRPTGASDNVFGQTQEHNSKVA
ncbi:MAG: hypothetical protein HRT94_03360 [Alphaproteobacteria bacterium]|nr:hypothetical protein [Alphaproteobacteria bacterium]